MRKAPAWKVDEGPDGYRAGLGEGAQGMTDHIPGRSRSSNNSDLSVSLSLSPPQRTE